MLSHIIITKYERNYFLHYQLIGNWYEKPFFFLTKNYKLVLMIPVDKYLFISIQNIMLYYTYI